jgi:hypothetical protein
MSKIKEWLRRYLPAEAFAVVSALLFSGIVYLLTKNRILAAYAGAIGDTGVFYLFIFIREHRADLSRSRKNNTKHGIKGFFRTVRNLAVEFGFSELLDSLFVRPFCMFIFPLLIGNFVLGILAGKIIADIIFYIPTITAYELRKKHLK